MINAVDTIRTSGWHMQNAYERFVPEFKRYKPYQIMKNIANDKETPPDYFLIWEGGISDPYCTKELANVKVPKAMWFSDSYPVKGYMDYFPFEVFWAKQTKPDIILMAQKGKIEDMKKETGIPTYWLPFAGDPLYHHEFSQVLYDISYVGTINPNKDHADYKKAEYLTLLAKNGYDIGITISHDGWKYFNVSTLPFHLWVYRPTLDEYSERVCWGKIGFNCNIAGDLTNRTFEIPLMNRPLLSNGGDNYNSIFEDGKNIIIYNNSNIIEKTKELIQDEGLRKTIAKNGYEKVIKSHTWGARIGQIEALVDNNIERYENSLYGK